MKTIHAMLVAIFATQLASANEREFAPVADITVSVVVGTAPEGRDASLVAHYDFNEELHGPAAVRDRSGHGVDLAAEGEGVIASTDGIFGRGVRFDGRAFFKATSNPLAGAETFTISLWFKTANPAENYKLAAAARWAGGNNATGWNIGTHYPEFWADEMRGSLRAEAGWERRVQFRANEWNHLALTYDGARVREYVNGHLATDVRGSGAALGAGVPMTVGAWMGTFHFQGALDEMRLYRRALAAEEIKRLHSNPG